MNEVSDLADGGALEGDALPEALRGARPAHADVAAALARARIAKSLFGAQTVVRIGRYEIEGKVGAGGGGEVFVARDPELSRRVAIKLMRAGGYRDHMLAEGQALARLSHPNIVPVYDAGTLDDQVYVVMELVEGDTLRAYGEAAGRSVRDLVRAYRQAAEGLDAAHRAGFIHRDFKPDNALVGRDGRVRVVDFGLARAGDVEPEAAAPASPVNVTHAGLGTPRYMPPEQRDGAALTPAADQYAFCASLRESLLCLGPLPRWLEAIVRRGTAEAPGDRYPSLAAVHAALGRDPASRWRRRGLVAAVLGLAAAAFIVGRGDRATQSSCEHGGAEIARLWNVGTAAQLAGHLGALATPYAHQAAPHVQATLADYATRWRIGDREACLAHRDGAQSTALLDRRVACLARARAALATAITVVVRATSDQLADAVSAISQLPDLDRCADPSVLLTPVPPPPPGVAPAVAVLANQLASLEVEVRAARPDVRSRIAALVTEARALGYPPLIARARRLEGVAALAVMAFRDALGPYSEATTLALTVGDQALAVESFSGRIYASAMTSAEAQVAGADLIAAISAGLPPSERVTRAGFERSLGSVALAAGKRDQARAAFERALAVAREVSGPERVRLAIIWTNLALTLDDPARRAALARERVSIVEGRLGDGHPLVLGARISAALLETDAQRARAQLAPPCTRLVELQPEHGVEILECEGELGWLAFERGDTAAAQQAFAIAVGTERAGGSGTPLKLAQVYLDLLAGRLAATAPLLDEIWTVDVPTLDAAAWWMFGDAADVMLARGAVARAAGRVAEARVAFETAVRYLERVTAASTIPRFTRRLAYAHASLVHTWPTGPLPAEARRHAEASIAWYRGAGGYADAIAALERALAR